MSGKSILFTIITAALAFAAGFALANRLNRSEIERTESELGRLKRQMPDGLGRGSGTSLSDDEIRAKLAEADKNPGNFDFQKSLGLGLYTYAAMKKDSSLFADIERLLDRAHRLNPGDYEVMVSLADIHFDLGRLKQSEEDIIEARTLYKKAVAKDPKDLNVRAALGLTYLRSRDPEPARAVAELRASYKLDPKHETTLQYLAEVYAAGDELEKAENYLGELRKVNGDNRAIPDLEKLIESKKQ